MEALRRPWPLGEGMSELWVPLSLVALQFELCSTELRLGQPQPLRAPDIVRRDQQMDMRTAGIEVWTGIRQPIRRSQLQPAPGQIFEDRFADNLPIGFLE